MTNNKKQTKFNSNLDQNEYPEWWYCLLLALHFFPDFFAETSSISRNLWRRVAKFDRLMQDQSLDRHESKYATVKTGNSQSSFAKRKMIITNVDPVDHQSSRMSTNTIEISYPFDCRGMSADTMHVQWRGRSSSDWTESMMEMSTRMDCVNHLNNKFDIRSDQDQESQSKIR
jgi:hypothetical protein